MAPASLLSIGELARRTGMSVSAIRFYEARGLVVAVRTSGNQRRFLRSDIRRLSLAKCRLYNPGDRAARAGAGPRFLLGDQPQDFEEADPSARDPGGRPPQR